MIQNATINEIQQIIARLPENRLEKILDFLKRIESLTDIQAKDNKLIQQIFDEDAELLSETK